MGGRRVSARAQSAMEYLLVTTFAMIILVPIIYLGYAHSATFSEDVGKAQVQRIGNEIIDATNAVYYAGVPAKKTLKLYFPDAITNIDIANTTLTFTLRSSSGAYEYSLSAATNMTGSLRPFAGLHVITIAADTDAVNITDS